MKPRVKRRRRAWDADLRSLSGATREPRYIPEKLRGCVNCRNARNPDRTDKCFPQYLCRLEEQAGQRGLFGSPQLHGPLHRCESWEQDPDA